MAQCGGESLLMLEDQFCAEKQTLEPFVQVEVADGRGPVSLLLLKTPIFEVAELTHRSQ